jgi:putative methionine-R-sulfoxide reductase with GAF domain
MAEADTTRIAELEAEIARLRAAVEDGQFVAELRARLAQTGAAGTLSAPSEYPELLGQIVETAMHVLGARAGSLYLIDEGSEELIFEVALGERAETLRGRRIPLGQGVAGWVAATGQAIAVADVQNDPRWAQEVGRAVGYAPTTMLAMPLLLRDRVTGVLQLLDKHGGQPFDAGDMATLGLFARQAAVAIEQSRTVHSLSALLRAAITSLGQDEDFAARATAFVAHTEESPEYADTMRLAALLGEIARSGDAGRRLALDITGAVVTYLRGRPRYT